MHVGLGCFARAMNQGAYAPDRRAATALHLFAQEREANRILMLLMGHGAAERREFVCIDQNSCGFH